MESINSILNKIETKLLHIDRVVFVLTLVFVLTFVKLLFKFSYGFIEEYDILLYSFPQHVGKIEIFFIVIIVSPIFETWIAQSLPFTLLNKVKYFNERSYLILLISAIFFGLNHFYSLFYMVYGFLMGLVFMYGYMIRIKFDNKTFYLIVICHSLVNLEGFIISLF